MSEQQTARERIDLDRYGRMLRSMRFAVMYPEEIAQVEEVERRVEQAMAQMKTVEEAAAALQSYEKNAKNVELTISAMLKEVDEEQRHKQRLRTRFGTRK